jgi:hypothetical protein
MYSPGHEHRHELGHGHSHRNEQVHGHGQRYIHGHGHARIIEHEQLHRHEHGRLWTRTLGIDIQHKQPTPAVELHSHWILRIQNQRSACLPSRYYI